MTVSGFDPFSTMDRLLGRTGFGEARNAAAVSACSSPRTSLEARRVRSSTAVWM